MNIVLNLIFMGFISLLVAQKTDFNHLNFKKADSTALTHKDEALSHLPLLAYNLTHHLKTDAEKFRAIYKWVTTNISNDFNLSDLNEAKQKAYRSDTLKLKTWNRKVSVKLYKQLLKNKSTICTGYAYLIKSLCEFANLDCRIVHGYGKLSTTDVENFKNPNHSWNAVLLNNKWYLADATWSSGKQNEETLEFQFDYSDGYFLTHPKLFAVNHYPITKKWLLLNHETYTFKQFLKAPIIYKNGFNYLNEYSSPKTLQTNIKVNKNVNFTYKFKQPIAKDKITVEVDNGFSYKQVNPKIKTGSKNALVLDYTFSKKGFYDVHVKYKNKYVATYTFNVVD